MENTNVETSTEEIPKSLDRFGDCPSCGTNWDGGDIYEVISQLDVNMNKTPESILKLVEAEYGYNTVNKKHFTKLVGITFDKSNGKPMPDFWKCPHCGTVWDSITNKNFSTLSEARQERLESSSLT